MSAKQTCPRRMGDLGPWERAEGLDRWDRKHGVIGQGEIGPSCSFCGSLHPDRFMDLVRAGWVVGPTDKNYKAYLGKPRTAEEIAARKAQWLAGTHGIAKAIRDLGERDGKTPEQIEADIEKEWAEREEPLIRDGCGQQAKFYFQHLSDEQRTEFIELANSGAMTIGYPGRFYRLPFFCTYREPGTPEGGTPDDSTEPAG